MEEAVPRSNEWRGADQNSGLLQEMTAARRHWVGDGGTSSGDAPFRALACFAVRPAARPGRTPTGPKATNNRKSQHDSNNHHQKTPSNTMVKNTELAGPQM